MTMSDERGGYRVDFVLSGRDCVGRMPHVSSRAPIEALPR
jgi:hypothetical protein